MLFRTWLLQKGLNLTLLPLDGRRSPGCPLSLRDTQRGDFHEYWAIVDALCAQVVCLEPTGKMFSFFLGKECPDPGQAVVVHAFDHNTWEAEAGGSL